MNRWVIRKEQRVAAHAIFGAALSKHIMVVELADAQPDHDQVAHRDLERIAGVGCRAPEHVKRGDRHV